MSKKRQENNVWQDRDIRFDSAKKDLELRRGEVMVDCLTEVEDTKGNNGDRGSLLITNLRLIWQSQRSSRTNLSIGYSTILSIKIRTAKNRLRGNRQALYIMTKFNKNSFEFIFTSLVDEKPNSKMFLTVQSIFRSYDTTRLYRDLKLRGAITRDKDLILLPHEQVYSKIQGVWNLSSDQGNLGTFFITNVRLVWHANLAENFNVSIPYLQMKSVRVRDSKFGSALVIETSSRSGGYVLGFRVDPPDRLKGIYKEIQSLHQVFSVSPIFGVDYKLDDQEAAAEKKPVVTETVQIDDTHSNVDAFAVYFTDGSKNKDREPVFDPQIGLAVEKLPDGATMSKLWTIVASTLDK